jgi:RNA polymerase sigma-70 factor, ECF subfamily
LAPPPPSASSGSASGAQPDVDAGLMAAVAAKDPKAQRRLVERLGARVRRLTGLLCIGAADADDAAQLAMLEILRSASTFRQPANLRAWADRITVRTTLREQRRERWRRSALLRWLSPGVLPWGNAALPGATERLGVDALLAEISPERRHAFVLRHALEYTVEEIADLTEAPPGTVKDRLVAGRKQLRLLLERDERRLRARGGA